MIKNRQLSINFSMLTDNVANIESVFLCHVNTLQEPCKAIADAIQTRTFLSDSDDKKEEADTQT